MRCIVCKELMNIFISTLNECLIVPFCRRGLFVGCMRRVEKPDGISGNLFALVVYRKHVIAVMQQDAFHNLGADVRGDESCTCLLYTSPSPRDRQKSRMPSSA